MEIYGFSISETDMVTKKFKENARKSKEVPGGKLSRLAVTKFNFHMQS